MDFHCMKRKQLQALCKKHKVPANLPNFDMANKLTELLKEKETPVIHVVMKEQEENANEAESNNVIVNRKVEKVRFSPDHELIEFTRVQEAKRRSRRNSICRADSDWSVESGEVNKENVNRWGRTTRTRELKIMEEEINQKKRGVKAVTCNNDGKTIVETFEDDKLKEGNVVEPGRVTRSRRKMEVQGFKNTSTKEKKGAKDDTKRDETASDDVNNEKQEEIVDKHSRVTRSTARKLTEAPAAVGKRGRRVVKNIGKVAAVRAEAVDNGDSGALYLSKRGDGGEGTSATVSEERMLDDNGDGLKENLVNKHIVGEHVTVEPPVLLRRSKRKANTIVDSEVFNNDTKKHENGGTKNPIKTSKFLASDGSQVEAEVTGSEVNQGRRAVLKIEEPIKKVEPRRSNRRKTVVESVDRKAETENRYPLRTSVPPPDIVPEVSKDDKMILQPIGVMRRCRRKTLSLKLDSANDTDSAVENLEAEKHVSEPCVDEENSAVQRNKCKPPGVLDEIGGDSNAHQNNKVMKRKRGHVSEGDAMKSNDHNSGAQPLKGSSSKKVVSAVGTGKLADEAKQPCLLDSPNMLDASLHSSLEIGESLFLDVQLPVSKDLESASNLCTKDIISDAELTPTRNTCRKRENFSVALSKVAQLERDSTVSEDQNCTSNIREVEQGNSVLEFDAQQSTDISGVDKNPEIQVCSQMEYPGCSNKINDQVLADGLDVSGKEGSDETRSSADSLLLGDQTDVKTDLKVAEIEADEHLQSCTRVVDHHTDLEHLEASNNILDNNEDASQTIEEVGDFVSYETDYTHSTGALKLKVMSSSMTRHHGDNVAEGNETLLHKDIEELAEAEEDGCSKECGNASNHISEFDMLDNGETCDGESSKGHMSKCDEDGEFSLANLFDAEGRYGITPQDTEKFSSETFEGESSKGHISKCDEDGEFSLANLFDAEGRYGITPQDTEKFSGETFEGESSKGHVSKCDEDGEFSLANIFDAEGIYGITPQGIEKFSGETREDESSKCLTSKCDEDEEFCLTNLFDAERRYRIAPQDREKFSGEHLVEDFDDQGMLHGSTFVAPITMCNSYGDHKANLSAEGGKTCDYKDKPSELTEADESGCLESQKSSKGEDWEFSVSNLLDGEKSTWIETRDLPAVSTVCVNYNEVKSGRDSSNSYETNPSTPSSVSENQDQQKSQLAKFDALAYSNQQQEALSNASELARNAVCFSKSYAEGKTSLVTEGLSADEDDKEDSAGACISDVKNCLISKIAAESLSDMKFQDSLETEQQHKNLQSRLTDLDVGEEATHATQRKSWTEIELHNLFGTTSDEDAPSGQDDTFCQESKIENMTMSKYKSTSGSLTNQKGKEMEGNSRNECAKTKYKDVVLPSGFNADIYENELKSLFATPVKIMTTCKIEKTYSHDRIPDSSVTSIKGCSETMKENIATESMSDRQAQNAGYEVESNVCNGASLSGNGGDDICKGINEVESVLLLSKSTGVLSGAEYDGCEGMEDQLAQNTVEFVKETNLLTGEDKKEHVIPLSQSCLHDEALEKNIISSSCSPCDLYELEGCAHKSETLSCHSKAHNKSEGEMIQNTEAVVESSDADLQKSDVPENNHLRTAGSDDGNDLRETPVETSSDPEEAKIGSSQNDVADEEHESYVFGAVSALLSSSAMPSHLGDRENGETNLEAGELSDIGGDDTREMINKVEIVILKDTSTTALSKTEYDGCEASEEQLTENTGECEKETNFMPEDSEENVNSLGQSCCNEGTYHVSESAEENTTSLSGSPNNLDKLNGCQDMLIDTALLDSLSYNSSAYQASEQEMAHEAALELSDADLSKNSHFTGCFEDDNISEEASLNTVSEPLVAELANISSCDDQSIDKGTSLHHSSKVSHVYDELTQRKDTDDLNEAKICDEIDAKANSSKDMSDELHINSEVELLKTLQDSDNLCADKLPCSAGLQSALLEAKEMGNTTQDLNTIVAPAEHGSSACGDVSSILSRSEMHLHLRDDNNDIKSLDVVGTHVFNLNRDNDKKNNEKAEENSTTQVIEFSIQELHFEENVEDLKNDTHTISDLPASGNNEMLEESDVADTIKEYIDSEPSLSVIFENSTASLSIDMLTNTDEMNACENSALSKHEDDNAGRLANSKDEDKTPSVDCLEEEATLFDEPAQVSGNAANSAGVALFAEGSAMKLDVQKKVETGQRSSSNEPRSTMRKNARTILIHGTPNKLHTMADMKENVQTHKSSNIGDITAVRPAKRKALQEVQWK